MSITLSQLLTKIAQQSEKLEFTEVMQVISEHYHYSPSRFSNGDVVNDAGSNEGSAKLFYFAQLNQLTEAQTLACFGQYYREDVLQNPTGQDHGNIRNFINTGWSGITFDDVVLVANT